MADNAAIKEAEATINGHIRGAAISLAEAQRVAESIKLSPVVEDLKTSQSWALTARRDLLEPRR